MAFIFFRNVLLFSLFSLITMGGGKSEQQAQISTTPSDMPQIYETFKKTVKLEPVTDNLWMWSYQFRTIKGSPYSRLGDYSFPYSKTEELPQILRMSRQYYHSYLKALEEYMDKTEKAFKENKNYTILPTLMNRQYINSKIDYMEVLKGTGLVDPYKFFAYPRELDFAKINNTLANSKLVKDTPPKTVIKTPYSGASSCVSFIHSKEATSSYRYEEWLALFIKDKMSNTLTCSGFNRGLIVQPYNSYMTEIGEFRIFAVNGKILFITFSNPMLEPINQMYPVVVRQGFFNAEGKILPPFEASMFVSGKFGGFRYILPEKILRNLRIKQETKWREDGLSSEEMIKRKSFIMKFFNQLKLSPEIYKNLAELVRKVYEISAVSGHPLSVNRIDVTVSITQRFNESLYSNPKFVVNEIEDITFGQASYLKIGPFSKQLLGRVFMKQ